ncbi:uncharacterized protein BP5553_02866 [Venustampulla echinocandica]|uniref:F-box domain-containing protein n=1 Tax=Venustampulla echinocandica TaxID=2656787 RepID=A0A370TSL6_9HELO|nr:uncharacterized protein BP5553_02866 [Venustampulla echinocandica]RDL38526.1 hypothetical protein BP5553_02866 [Venustampulla echinocandica]
MPAEILDIIFASLSQLDLHVLMLANSNFVEVAATYLYSHPLFSSTYRFAQFVWVVSHKPHYASMVRILDLSYLSRIATDTASGELLPLAGWREFKYRNHDMYRAWVRSSPLASGSPKTSTHSLPSPFLKSYHRTRDVPIGGLCHVLAACPRIRKLNLSRVQLAADFLVSNPLFKPTATQGLLFVSDVPKSWTWASSDLQPVYAEEVVRWVCRLVELESLNARACLWLTTVRVEKLMSSAQNSLKRVDFRESGMQKEVRWALKGNKSEVERIVREVIQNTRERVVT